MLFFISVNKSKKKGLWTFYDEDILLIGHCFYQFVIARIAFSLDLFFRPTFVCH